MTDRLKMYVSFILGGIFIYLFTTIYLTGALNILCMLVSAVSLSIFTYYFIKTRFINILRTVQHWLGKD